MSAITNKDRITENNDKINRLIELAKQKGPTSNPKQAATEDEMDAMITDKNVGKVIKYTGESGGKYEKDALYIIAEGDGTDSGLFARRLNITEGTLSITENGTYDVMNKASVEVNTPVPEGSLSITENGTYDVSYKASVEVNVTGSGGSDSNKLVLVVGEQSADNLYDITAEDLEGVTGLVSYAFYYRAGLRSIDLSNVTSMGRSAFQYCSALTSADVPNATSIGDSAFRGCNALTSADMPNATSIGDSAFRDCNALTSASMPNATSIGGSAFQYCYALASIDMSNATSIGNSAFYYCSALTTANIPNVESIGSSAFRGCEALTSLTIPSTCTSIGSYALFGSESNKSTFTFEGTTPPSIQSNTFASSYLNKIIVPAGCGETYKTATNWSNFASYIEEATE